MWGPPGTRPALADYLITAIPRHFPPFWKQSKIISPRQFITLSAPHSFPDARAVIPSFEGSLLLL
jgi:hypothetical protein